MTVFARPPGEATRALTPDGVFLQAHVHPHGATAVCWGATAGEARLWLCQIDGSRMEAIGPERARHPAFDADGRRVAFAVTEGSDPIDPADPRARSGVPPPGMATSLWTLDLESDVLTQVTDGPSQDQRPCWSPGGATIAFIRDNRLVAVPSAGGEVTHLGNLPFAYRPWYSVDGAELFFFTVVDGRRQTHRMPADGGPPVSMANDDRGHTHGPFADPAGEHLIVHSTRDGEWALFELPLDGSSPRRIDIAGMAAFGHGTRSKNGVLVFDGQTMD